MTDGIKIDISLTSTAKEDEQDGDVDVKVTIAPNATYKVTSISFTPTDESNEEEYSKITEEDEKFMGNLNATIELADEFAKEVINDEKIDGKKHVVSAVWSEIEAEIETLKDEHEKKYKYATIHISKRGDVTLVVTRTYTKQGEDITVNLGSINVDLEKIVITKEEEIIMEKGYPVPSGYELVHGELSKTGQRIYKLRGKNRYISRDIADGGESHSGGVWKMATSVENLNKKETRLGTYDENLVRIGP